MTLPSSVEQWRNRGRRSRVRGIDVFHVVEGHGPSVLLLHGFPTSGFDWRHVVAPLRDAGRRVIVPDLPGYGLSGKPRAYSYSLIEQADVLLDLLHALDVSSLDIVAHDMGTSVSCELLARREESRLPFKLRSLTLTNGSVYIEMAHLTPSQKILRRPRLGPLFARLSNGIAFRAQFKRLFGDPDSVSRDELDALWALMREEDGALRLPQLIQYIAERTLRAPRWLPPLRHLDDVPTMVMWGRRDPVAVFAIAERLAREIPSSRFVPLDGLGHYPQLEDPARVAATLARFLDDVSPTQP